MLGMPMREEDFRKKIVWFTFAFSILVVWAHSFNAELFMGATKAGDRIYEIESFFGETAAQIAVPGFFMLSGYLFYRGFTWKKLGSKWKSRIRSVLVPYLLWNGLYYLGYVIGSHLPAVGDLMGKGEIPFRLEMLVEAMIHHTYLYVFWYLSQLICLIALAPVLYGVLKHSWAGILYLTALLIVILEKKDLPVVNEDALFYYSAAGFAALKGKTWIEENWSGKRFFAGILMLAAAAGNFELAGRTYEPFFAVCYRFLAPAGLWMIVDERRLGRPRVWMNYNFFLYALHFAFVRFINKGGAILFHQLFPAAKDTGPGLWPAGLVPLILYLIMPFIMVMISSRIGSALKKICPRGFYLLNGGR